MARSRFKDGAYFIRSLLTNQPFIIERDWTEGMVRQLKGILTAHPPFDAIHADQLWMAPYALWARQLTNGTAPLLTLDQHNAVYMILQRMADGERNPLKRALLQLEAHKLLHYERNTCQAFDHVVWVTQEDHRALQRTAANTSASVPNAGVIPICSDPAAIAPIARRPNARRVTFLGGLHYPPNAQGVLWFAEQVFPDILAQCPEAVLTVIGKQPPADLSRLGIPSTNLAVLGYVKDPQTILADTAVFIVPLLAGGGMRVKIIEGWSWGLPIVSTTVGAEGIMLIPGQQMLIANTPQDFAQAVLHLLSDRAAADRIALGGRAWVLENYNWRTIYREWDAIYP
jgi:glycosyltransferase involved in cell wall biosynthesis